MPDPQQPVYRRCDIDSCGYCMLGKAPDKPVNGKDVFKRRCSYLAAMDPNNFDIEIEDVDGKKPCKYKLLEIQVLAQRSPKSKDEDVRWGRTWEDDAIEHSERPEIEHAQYKESGLGLDQTTRNSMSVHDFIQALSKTNSAR